ncbi:hypothetical protein G7046_g3441 [Stylonectria norvegica]|nr:hypothetical protein G7046_g3441 [Stylonectria norvegica]
MQSTDLRNVASMALNVVGGFAEKHGNTDKMTVPEYAGLTAVRILDSPVAVESCLTGGYVHARDSRIPSRSRLVHAELSLTSRVGLEKVPGGREWRVRWRCGLHREAAPAVSVGEPSGVRGVKHRPRLEPDVARPGQGYVLETGRYVLRALGLSRLHPLPTCKSVAVRIPRAAGIAGIAGTLGRRTLARELAAHRAGVVRRSAPGYVSGCFHASQGIAGMQVTWVFVWLVRRPSTTVPGATHPAPPPAGIILEEDSLNLKTYYIRANTYFKSPIDRLSPKAWNHAEVTRTIHRQIPLQFYLEATGQQPAVELDNKISKHQSITTTQASQEARRAPTVPTSTSILYSPSYFTPNGPYPRTRTRSCASSGGAKGLTLASHPSDPGLTSTLSTAPALSSHHLPHLPHSSPSTGSAGSAYKGQAIPSFATRPPTLNNILLHILNSTIMISVPRLPQTHSTSPQQYHYNHYNNHNTHDNHRDTNNNHSQQIPYSHNSHNYSNAPIDLAHLPRSTSHLDDNFAIFGDNHLPSDFMQSDSWGPVAAFNPRSNRFTHNRDNSRSSLSSTAGSASPYAHNTSNPHIAVTESPHGSLVDQPGVVHSQGSNNQNNYYQVAKPIDPYQGYQNSGALDHAVPEMAYPVAVSGPNGRPRVDRGLLPAPDFAGSSRSHPTSVASSIAGDSPATPTIGDSDFTDRRRKVYHNVPKLDRTMTDVYSDELYSPNFAITSSTSPSQNQMAVSPTNDVFSQRLHTANNQHLSAVHSPASSTSRDRSPFRHGSPLAPSPSHDFGNASLNHNLQFNSAQRMREQNKAQQDAQMDARLLHQQLSQGQEPETPKTISPKDAILEFNEIEGESNFPLFPQESTSFEMEQFSKAMNNNHSHNAGPQANQANDGGSGAHFNYMPSQLPTGIPVPQQYPFIANSLLSHDTPPRLSSAGSSSTDSGSNTPIHHARPTGVGAEGGTYTCTYHGCTLRFETPTLLQKHKREGHRQTQVINGPRPRDMGMTSSLLNSQAGPHRCDRINPSTGKSCNTVFSRPYDLTRHEDTIHNARKMKVRCDLCTEEKTFSRADALTRHYRVCHPDMELPGKQRRRAGS